jgi:hypothetical protein
VGWPSKPCAILCGLGLWLGLTSSAFCQEQRLELEVKSSCPTAALVRAQLSPLLRDYELSAESPSHTAQVEDLGESYSVRIGSAWRKIRDPERDCLERARVAAVFLALNLPTPATQPALVASPPTSTPSEDTGEAPVGAVADEGRSFAAALRLLALAETAPGAGVVTTGAGAGVTLPLGPLAFSLLATVTTPTRPYQVDSQPRQFELWRVPLAALLHLGRDFGGLGLGIESGLALDILRFRGESVPNPDTLVRVNPGWRVNGMLSWRADRRLGAFLLPEISFFPRTYVVRVEPTSVLAETPRWWIGLSLGLEYRVWAY